MQKACFVFLFLWACLLPSVVLADPTAANSTTISGTTGVQIKTGPGIFWGVTSQGIQTNPISCYNNTSAAAPLLLTSLLGSVGATTTGFPTGGVAFTTGLFCVVPTAIVTSVIVWWN